MANGRIGLLGGLAQGITAGAGIAAQAQDLQLRRQEQEQAAARGRIESAFKYLAHPAVPGKTKADVYNRVFLPSMKALNPGLELPQIQEWPLELGDYIKRASKVWGDKTFSEAEKLDVITQIAVEAQDHPTFAPMIQQLRLQAEDERKQLIMGAADVHAKMLTKSATVEELEWLATERARAQTDERRAMALLEGAREGEKRVRDRSIKRLDAYTDVRGNRILVVEGEGKVAHINLGKTQERATFNLGQARMNLARRAEGLAVDDSDIGQLDPKVAAAVLDRLSKSDFLGQLIGRLFRGEDAPRSQADEDAAAAEQFLQGQ